MHASLANGCNFWNGGEIYGPPSYNSMILLERYFAKYPEDAEKVVLSIKGGINMALFTPDGSPEGIRRSLDNILEKLGGRVKVDVFECARRDPNTPLEVTFGVIEKEYIQTGKVGAISLSECSAATIHEAVKITKVAAVEVELSLWSTDVLSNGIAEACAQYDIPLVAYAPLGRGVGFPSPSNRFILEKYISSANILCLNRCSRAN
jgi:pyridoxine 4-dehydrogenase